MKRQFNPAELELMDRPQPVSAELESDLENIRELNRWFGSYALISMFLSRWIKPGARLRIIDLATGSGDTPRIAAPAFLNSPRKPLNSIASLVQPEVSSFG